MSYYIEIIPGSPYYGKVKIKSWFSKAIPWKFFANSV